MDKHKNVRKHIAAAKGWLNEAESSIDKKNDIRGDLNIMLAQAELQRAQEKKPRNKWLIWLMRLLPLAVAVIVAVGYVIYLRPEPVVNKPVAAESSEVLAESVVKSPDGELDEVYAEVPQDEEINTADIYNDSADITQDITPQAENVVAQPKPLTTESPQLPDEEMQKLMQSAGNILRE